MSERAVKGVIDIVAEGLASKCRCLSSLLLLIRLLLCMIAMALREVDGSTGAHGAALLLPWFEMRTFDARSCNDTICPLGAVVLVSLVRLGFASEIVDVEARHLGRHSEVDVGRDVGVWV